LHSQHRRNKPGTRVDRSPEAKPIALRYLQVGRETLHAVCQHTAV
jgi:hypothetical protein